MKRIWTESSAIRFLHNHGKIKEHLLSFLIQKGSVGLTGLGAADFLKNHCGKYVLFVNSL